MNTKTNTETDVPLLHDGMHHCEDCRQTVLMPSGRRYECLENDDTIYCPRCARDHMDTDEWDLRWGDELALLDEIREDRSLALKYTLPGCPAHYIVHDEDHVYEQWFRCEDEDERRFTTAGEVYVISAMKQATFGAYAVDPPMTVRIVNAPINADHPDTDAVPMSYERA